MTRPLVYLLILALAACQQQCPTPAIAVKEWTPAEQREILAEEEKLADDSILISVMQDYAKLRREVR